MGGHLGARDRGLAPSTWPRLSQHLLCGHLLFGGPLLGPVRTPRPQVLEHRPFYFYLRKARVKVAQSWPTLYDPLHYTCVSLHFLEFSRSGY